MKTIKLPHLLFSIAVIAALVMAAIPAAPAYALTPSASAQASVTAADTNDSPTLSAGAVVCFTKVVWRDGKRVAIRVCKRIHRPNAQ